MNDMITISVCVGTSCHLNGSYNVLQIFQQLTEQYSIHDQIDFKACFCRKECQNHGVSISIDKDNFRVTSEEADAFFKKEILKKCNNQ
jgi:NADH:ubiquinone oxidoreductase subunit E